MGQFWLISVPASGNKQERFTAVKNALGSAGNGEAAPFVIPDLKVGTLDSLVTLSDELNKVDSTAEAATNKLVDIMKNLLNNDIKQIEATLLISDKTPDAYLRSFSWNAMKYRVDKPLRELVDAIQQEVTQIDSMMKTRLNAYNQVKSNMVAIDRKQTGNLAVRSLVDIVKKEHFVLDSEYLCTVLIAVPKNLYKEWAAMYETLTEMVVPRSSQKIAEDEEYGLFSVIVFQKVAEQFGNKCRENKFIPRDYTFNEKDLEQSKKQRSELGAMEKEQWGQLLRLAKTNFGEIFSCWVHIKAIRIFVESVLRYGLPPDFMAAVIEPKSKSEKKARDQLNALFGDVKRTKKDKALEQEVEEMSIIVGVEKEFFNYVNFTLSFSIH